jgi:hypothetical protein
MTGFDLALTEVHMSRCKQRRRSTRSRLQEKQEKSRSGTLGESASLQRRQPSAHPLRSDGRRYIPGPDSCVRNQFRVLQGPLGKSFQLDAAEIYFARSVQSRIWASRTSETAFDWHVRCSFTVHGIPSKATARNKGVDIVGRLGHQRSGTARRARLLLRHYL